MSTNSPASMSVVGSCEAEATQDNVVKRATQNSSLAADMTATYKRRLL